MSSLTGNQQFVFVDGSTGVHSFASGAANIGTLATSTRLRIVASISLLTKGNTLSQVTGITDSEGFTWHKAGQVSQTGINQPGGLSGAPLTEDLEIWYTDNFVSTAMASPTTYQITVAVDNDIDSVAIYYGCQKNIDAASPLDANGSLPASATVMSGSSSTASVSGISTNTANTHVVVVFSAVGPGQRPGAGGAPDVDGVTSSDYGVGDSFHLNQNYQINGIYVYDRTSALASATIHTHDATNNQMMLVVAFTEDATTPSGTWASTGTPDAMAFIGYPGVPGVRGDLNALSPSDTFAGAGYTASTGLIVWQEATDQFSAYGFQPLTGTLSVTEGTDRFSAAGIGRGEDGVFITTETSDIFSASGNTPIAGIWGSTETTDKFRFIGAGVTQVRRRRRRFVT